MGASSVEQGFYFRFCFPSWPSGPSQTRHQRDASPTSKAHRVTAHLSVQAIRDLRHLQGPTTTHAELPRAELSSPTMILVTCKSPPPSPGMSFKSAQSTARRINCVGGMLSSVCSNGCPPRSQSTVVALANPRCICRMQTWPYRQQRMQGRVKQRGFVRYAMALA